MIKATAFKVSLILTIAGGLAACREGEQNRPLSHEPGVYSGKKDEKLNEQQNQALRERTKYQGRR